MDWLTYLLVCSDGTLYCGMTNDLRRRLDAHNRGCGAKYTSGRRPVRVVAVRERLTRRQAARLECSVKKVVKSRKAEVLKNGDVG